MTRGGGTSGYPMGNLHTPRSQGSAGQSMDKESDVLRVEEDSHTNTVSSTLPQTVPFDLSRSTNVMATQSPTRLEVMIDTKRQVIYDHSEVQLFDHEVGQEMKAPSV